MIWEKPKYVHAKFGLYHVSKYSISLFAQNFVRFRILDMEIQMKRAKSLILTYFLTYLLNTLVIDSAISWLKLGGKFCTGESNENVTPCSRKPVKPGMCVDPITHIIPLHLV